MVRGNASSPGGDSLRVRDLLDVPGLGLRLLTDGTGLDRAIQHVYTTDLPDPGRYLTAGDLVLTGMMWCREPGDAERFVTVLARAGTAVPGAGEALGQVPPEVIQACGRHGVTLLAVPPETSFAVVPEEVGVRGGAAAAGARGGGAGGGAPAAAGPGGAAGGRGGARARAGGSQGRPAA